MYMKNVPSLDGSKNGEQDIFFLEPLWQASNEVNLIKKWGHIQRNIDKCSNIMVLKV